MSQDLCQRKRGDQIVAAHAAAVFCADCTFGKVCNLGEPLDHDFGGFREGVYIASGEQETFSEEVVGRFEAHFGDGAKPGASDDVIRCS